MNNFVPLTELRSAAEMKADPFFSEMVKRHAASEDDGIYRRLQNIECQKCQEEYRRKYPDTPFKPNCQGIYDEVDFQELADLTGMTILEAAEFLDVETWAESYIVIADKDGNYLPYSSEDRPFQRAVLKCTAQHQVDRMGRGMGKALALDTPIPTPSGWTTMREVKVGDYVLGENGLPTRVSFTTDIMYDHACYDVEFSDGSVITADAEHLWKTSTASGREKNETLILSTEEIRDTLYVPGGSRKYERNHSVKNCQPVALPVIDLPLDPYSLGEWVGQAGSEAVLPQPYLRGSFSQRLAVLRGLMDAAGDIQDYGRADFVHSSLDLSNAVFELAASLGMKPVFHEPTSLHRKSYRVGFAPTVDVFRDSRKKRQQKKTLNPSATRRFIVSVKERSSVPVRCIQVENRDRMYLAGRAFIPTHNTTLGVATELHKVMNNKNYEILVLCPSKAQSQMWYEEINKQFDNSPMLRGALKNSKQAPYFLFEMHNGAKIKIFTAGSKAGRGADAIRGQSPRRVRLDEQDYLVEADYNAIMALLRRYPESEFHGSSTPKGDRSMYWSMCTQFPAYREFHIPVTERLDWSPELEAELRREAKTADRYNQEYLALFGDPGQGVFKSMMVDASKKHYDYAQVIYDDTLKKVLNVVWNDCMPKSNCRYVMGIDWNGGGTGTRMRITEFDTQTKVRRCVYKETVDQDGATTLISMEHIRQLNRIWHLDHIYCDKGFGFAQDELIRQMGANPEEGHKFDDQKLLDVKFVGSKESLKTNRLVPKRDQNSPYIEDKELERQTKPFMVEGCQMALEQGMIVFSMDDERLEAQMRDYRVKTYTANGQPNSYEAKIEGDHDLDAWILSMLGIELNYGLFYDGDAQARLAAMTHVSSFGNGIEDRIEAARSRMLSTNTPSRAIQTQPQGDDWNVLFSGKNSSIVAPISFGGRAANFSRGIRTSTFQQNSRSRQVGPESNPNSGSNQFGLLGNLGSRFGGRSGSSRGRC